jgi:anti-repressor protein
MLIPINDENQDYPVSARDLHGFLMSKRQFGNWIQERIGKYGFIEGEDFLTNLLKTPEGGRPSKEYTISLSMAKELSMVEANKEGKEARKYFIDAEKAGRALYEAISTADPLVLRKMADLSEEKQKLEVKTKLLQCNLDSAKEEITELKPMAEYGEKIFTSENCYTATNVGSVLGISPIKLNKILRQKGVIKLGSGSADYELTSKFNKYNLAKSFNYAITHKDGTVETKLQLKWTRKGYDWLIEQMSKPENKLTEGTINK